MIHMIDGTKKKGGDDIDYKASCLSAHTGFWICVYQHYTLNLTADVKGMIHP